MGKAADDNDLLRSGQLPDDPFSGLEPSQTKNAPAEAAPVVEQFAWLREMFAPVGFDFLERMPPKRRYLLRAKLEGESFDVLPLGKVGMLAAAGGTGKSWALAQLAIAVATGKPWFGCFEVETPGRVLLALGEEEREEIQRRLHTAARVAGLSPAERAQAANNIVALPLCGRSVALTQGPEELRRFGEWHAGGLPETRLVEELRALLTEGGEWSLLIFDPLSRFAGPDIEKDSAAATRFVQVLETFTSSPGNPTVLFAHHTTKAGTPAGKAQREAEQDRLSADVARGTSALKDGVRWQANMLNLDRRQGAPELTAFRVSKTNYGRQMDAIHLLREPSNGGAMRLATADEVRRWEAAATTKEKPSESGRGEAKRGAGYGGVNG